MERCGALAARRSDIEIIIVDNGSEDESFKLISELLPQYPACRVIRLPINKGYGYGILAGLRSAQGEILAWTHADMQTDPMDTLKGLAFFEDARQPELIFVKGCRQGRPLADIFFSVGMSFFETILLHRFFWDINAQPSMFHRRFFDAWINPPDDFSLDLFAYNYAKLLQLNIKRFPVLFSKRLHGLSRWNINWAAKIKFIKRTISYSIRLRRQFSA